MGDLSNTTINGVSYDFKDAGAARQSHSHTKSQITDFPTSMPASDVPAWAKASSKPTYTASEVGAIATTAKGAASGVAELDANGKVPSSQLPSFVDDVLEYSAKSSFPTTGETGKIYVDTSNNKTYRWSGSAYVEISPSLALGETSSTAYRGDRGKAAYDHSQTTSGNPHNVTKSDVGLDNVGNFKAVSTVASQGLSDTEKANARTNIGAGTSSLTLGTSSTQAAPGNHTHNYAGSSSAGGAATSANKLNTNAGSATQPVYFSNGIPVATTYSLGKSVPSNAVFTDTTYSVATSSANGLMSSGDKTIVNKLSSNSYTAMTPTLDTISIITGGYIMIGKLCIVNMTFELVSGTCPTVIFEDAPKPVNKVSVAAIGEYNDAILTFDGFGCIIADTQSRIRTNTYYSINAVFMVK